MAMYYGKRKITPVVVKNYPNKGNINLNSNGVFNIKGYETATVEIQEQEKFKVTVYDYDGSVLDEVELLNGEVYTLPNPPTHHDRLVFQEWSSPKVITDNTITINGDDVVVGAVYTTKSGLSEFDIELTKVTGLTATLNMDGTKDWGDGTSDTETSHTYAELGEYTIKCDGTTIPIVNDTNIFGSSSDFSCKSAFLAGNLNVTKFTFYACKNLKYVTFAKEVYSNYVYFLSCSMLKCLIFHSSGAKFSFNLYSVYSCDSLSALVLPSYYTSVGQYGIASCPILETVVFPDSGVGIGDHGMYNNYSLKKLRNIKSFSNSAFENDYSLESVECHPSATESLVGSSVFSKCYKLKNVKLPDSTKTLKSSLFNYCHSLESVKIPSGVTALSGSTFSYCYNLKSVELPENLTTLKGYEFQMCMNLTNINIPETVTSIGSAVFNGCRNLKYLKIPSGVTTIPSNAFLSCFGLEILDFSNATVVPTIADTTLFQLKQCKVAVPDRLYDEWIMATNWATGANQIYKASEVEL